MKDLRATPAGGLIADAIEAYLQSIFPPTSDDIPYSCFSPVYAKRTRAEVE
jgi:hypothetical protein